MSEFRLVAFMDNGNPATGVVKGDFIYPLKAILGAGACDDMAAILADWRANRQKIEATLSGSDLPPPLALDSVELLSPLTSPGGIFCAGANYGDHSAEMSKSSDQTGAPPASAKPWYFIKYSRCATGPNADVHLPAGSQKVDWEAELAVIIGETVRNVDAKDALGCVAGYAIANDLSARDLSRRPEVAAESPFRMDWLSHKSFDGSCPLGPWITLADDVPDPQDLGIRLWVNDELMQESNTGAMIFSVAEQIAHLSKNLTLHPGDVILTGTPAGVGMGRGRFLKSGDVVTVEVEGLGRLRNRMV